MPCIKINSKLIKGFYVRPGTAKSLEENVEGNSLTLVWAMISWIWHQKQKQQKQK